MDVLTRIKDVVRPSAAVRIDRTEVILAVAAFAVMCIAVLRYAPYLVEPDDYAYRASIIAVTQGHFLSLSNAQAHELSALLTRTYGGGPHAGPRLGPGGGGPGGGPPPPVLVQWVQLADGRWISEKDPGYPYLAAPFQALGIIRWAPLFYGALGCLGLFFGARRWLGRFGGAAAVGLFCSSGAALLFAWRDYMPTFTDASLIAAGTGALLWAVLAVEASSRRRTVAGLAGLVAIEAAVFVRYTNVVVLGCAVLAVVVAWRLRGVRLPRAALVWWLGSVAVFGAGVALFDDLVYGGPLKTGYQPGEIVFSLSSILPNFRIMPPHLIDAMPMLVLGLGALAWIAARRFALRSADAEPAALARRDFGVGLALAASWFSVWGLYSAYSWTAQPGGSTLQFARFYVPAIGAISLLGAWLVVRVAAVLMHVAARVPARERGLAARVPYRAPLASVTTVVVIAAMFGLGLWSFNDMRDFRLAGGHPPPGVQFIRGRPPGGQGHVRLTTR